MLGSSARNVLRRQLLSHEILIMMLSLLLSRSPNYAVFLDYTEICWWIRGFDLWPLRSKRDLFLQAFESRFTVGGSYCTVTVRRNAKTTRRLQPVDMCGGRRPIARLASSCRHRRLVTRTTGPSPSPSAVLALHGRVTRTAACLPLRCRAGARAESDRARGGGRPLPHAAMRRRHWHGTPTEPTGPPARRPAAPRQQLDEHACTARAQARRGATWCFGSRPRVRTPPRPPPPSVSRYALTHTEHWTEHDMQRCLYRPAQGTADSPAENQIKIATLQVYAEDHAWSTEAMDCLQLAWFLPENPTPSIRSKISSFFIHLTRINTKSKRLN